MTCVAAIVDNERKIHFGSDSLASDMHAKTVLTDAKIFHLGEMIVGFAGSFRSAQILQYQMPLPERAEGQSDMDFLVNSFVSLARVILYENGLAQPQIGHSVIEGEFILGYRGKIYRMQSDFSIIHACDDFIAIGDGGESAAAVLHATKLLDLPPIDRLEMALDATEYQIKSVQRPFHFVSVDEAGAPFLMDDRIDE